MKKNILLLWRLCDKHFRRIFGLKRRLYGVWYIEPLESLRATYGIEVEKQLV